MTSPDAPYNVSASTVVQAPASVIFDIVADPRQHSRIDGSGSVRGTTSGPDRLTMGSTFGMDMKIALPYKMTSEVVEYDENRLLAWKTKGLHRWRYELEPLAQAAGGGTRVTETWDISHYPGAVRLIFKAIGFPSRNRRGIEQTLVKLKAAAEQDASTA